MSASKAGQQRTSVLWYASRNVLLIALGWLRSWIVPRMMNCLSYRPSSRVVWLVPRLIKFFSTLLILLMQKDFQLEICSQRRVESNWRIFLIIVQRMFTYQLTINKGRKYYSFVFSLLPVVLFPYVGCMLHPGRKRGLAVCLLGCGLAPLLLLCSLSFFSPCCTALLAVLQYLWLWLMTMMASLTRDLGTQEHPPLSDKYLNSFRVTWFMFIRSEKWIFWIQQGLNLW